ncbi:MAG TPA: universal stress protein [Baekduia sp.]|nr:universal stress protein [Baekduia sp.]
MSSDDHAPGLLDAPRYNHVLVAVDASSTSEFMLRHVVHHAVIDRSRLTLMTVIVPPSATTAMAGVAPERLLADTEAFAEKHLRQFASRIPESVSVTTIVRRGRAAEEIVRAADELAVDVVCVGSRGRPRAASALLGSVSASVMHHSPVPVLVFHPPAR